MHECPFCTALKSIDGESVAMWCETCSVSQPVTLESHKPTPGASFVALVNALCKMELAERINLIDFWADKDLNLYASVICGAPDGD